MGAASNLRRSRLSDGRQKPEAQNSVRRIKEITQKISQITHHMSFPTISEVTISTIFDVLHLQRRVVFETREIGLARLMIPKNLCDRFDGNSTGPQITWNNPPHIIWKTHT